MPAVKDSQAYRKLVEQIADKVWKRWQAEMRQQRDRRATRQIKR